MSCRRGKRAPQMGRRRRQGIPCATLRSLLLVHLCFVTVLPEVTGSTNEIIDNDRMSIVKDLVETPMNVCLRPLEGRPIIEATLRLEVKPIGPGSDKFHLAGSVAVPSSLLQPESGWSLLRYEYSTTVDKQVVLKAWLNDVELPYEHFANMYSGRYNFHAVKLYMQGRVELIYGCTQPPTATATATTTTTTTTIAAPTERLPTSRGAHEHTKVLTNTPATNNKPAELPNHDVTTKSNIGASTNTPAESTPNNSTVQAGTPWIWALGAAGPVPILIIVVVAVVLVLIVTIPAVILVCWPKCRKKPASTTRSSSKKITDPFKNNSKPLLNQHSQSSTKRDDLENSITLVNPAYKQLATTGQPPCYYSGN